MKITYTNNRGNSVVLSEKPYFLDPESLFDYEWSYSSKETGTGSRIKGFNKPIKEKQLTLTVYGPTQKARNKAIDEFNSIIEADIFDGTIGKLTVDNWYCYCYITAAANSNWRHDVPAVEKKITITNERQAWYNVLKKDSYGNVIKTEAASYDMQYSPCFTFPYDYTNAADSQLILINPSVNDSEFVLNIQGPAEKPYLQIGDNVYHMTIDVPEGANLKIDSTKKTAFMTLVDGTIINVFGARDSGYYIFKRIASGRNSVVYDGSFIWQLEVIEERSEPRWLTE